MNRVGVSVVSATTQTPASGPFGPLTTPPISSASMATTAAPAPRCSAWVQVVDSAKMPATPSAVNAPKAHDATLVVFTPLIARSTERDESGASLLRWTCGVNYLGPPGCMLTYKDAAPAAQHERRMPLPARLCVARWRPFRSAGT